MVTWTWCNNRLEIDHTYTYIHTCFSPSPPSVGAALIIRTAPPIRGIDARARHNAAAPLGRTKAAAERSMDASSRSCSSNEGASDRGLGIWYTDAMGRCLLVYTPCVVFVGGVGGGMSGWDTCGWVLKGWDDE